MVKKGLLFLFALMITGYVNGQANILNAKSAKEINKKSAEQLAIDKDGPLPYGYVSERDVMWSKVVWEFIDLNQKINSAIK